MNPRHHSLITRLGTLVVLAALLCASGVIAAPASAPTVPSPPPQRPATGGQSQFGPRGSGSIAIWEDRAVAADPLLESAAGTSNIVGINLEANQALVVSDAPGDQLAPAISGSVVVWMDTGHSCPTCEADIYAKDLSTGVTFPIATGPQDQVFPAIGGGLLCGSRMTARDNGCLRLILNTRTSSRLRRLLTGQHLAAR